MKKNYQNAELEVVAISLEDVIVTSGGTNNNNPDNDVDTGGSLWP